MDLSNRYDLMIKMDLSKKALEEFDNGEIHKEWKESFGKDIMNKTIFDCDQQSLHKIRIQEKGENNIENKNYSNFQWL